MRAILTGAINRLVISSSRCGCLMFWSDVRDQVKMAELEELDMGNTSCKEKKTEGGGSFESNFALLERYFLELSSIGGTDKSTDTKGD